MGKDLNGNELGQGIAQRKSGIYEMRFVNKFGKRISISGKDLPSLMEKYRTYILEEYKYGILEDRITLNDWFDKWLDIYKSTTKVGTQTLYSHTYNNFIRNKLGNKQLTDITNTDIQQLINGLNEYSYEVKNKIKLILSDMFNKAILNNYAIKNPAKGLRIPITKQKREMVVLTRNQQKDFFDYTKGTFYYNLYVVAVNTGLRVGEIVSLTEDDLDFDEHFININKTLKYAETIDNEQKHFYIETPKTQNSYRKVPMSEQCEKALKQQIVLCNIVKAKAPLTKKVSNKSFNDFIFCTRFGTPLNTQILNDDIKKIIKDINFMKSDIEQIPMFSMHTFRHTFATRCFEAGIPIKTVQEYLGHATLSMTSDLYTDVQNEQKALGIQQLNTLYEDINADD